jgi:Domain of unknown function (DUF4198)
MMKEGVTAMSKFQCAATAILILSLINTAHAHYVWLERDGEGSAYAYFGEWVDDIREKAGGLLDRIKAPLAFLGASTTPLPIKRHDDKLEITVSGKGDIRLVENGVPPRDDSEKGGITRTIYYAKTGRSETAAKLDLELVPTAAEGSTLVLLFHGAPLAKTEVTLIGPPKWEKHLTTDEQGRVTLPTPWSGRYVLEVTYFDAKPGGSGNDKFDRTRHITSLSFVQRDGQAWSAKP